MIPRRPRTLHGVLAMLIALCLTLVPGFAPTTAATGQSLDVDITGLTPSSIGKSGRVTLSGTVTNTGSKDWTALQAYLLIRPAPFTDREDLAEQAEVDHGFAGTRIVDVGRFQELGDLAAGASVNFRLSIPVKNLPINGTDGVYPIGVQILGTDAAGNRSSTAVARATTLIPKMTGTKQSAATTVVWPFLLPAKRGSKELLAAISTGGQLRNLLDLAIRTGSSGRGVIVDPALVAAVDKLSEDEPDAERFRDDLIAISTDSSAWVLDYDRADVLALVRDTTARRHLIGAVERATDSVVDQFGLSRSRVSWPTQNGTSGALLSSIRESGDDPVIVSSLALPDWTSDEGALVSRSTRSGDLPLLVDDDVTRGIPGTLTVATLRQRILAGTALAALNDASGAESVVVVPPRFDPGQLATLEFESDYAQPRSLTAVPRGSRYTGKVEKATDVPLSQEQISASDQAAQTAAVVSAAAVDHDQVDDLQAVMIADTLGVRWRGKSSGGLAKARGVERKIRADLEAITLMAPPEVTLSSSEGGFPITISNGSGHAVRIGLRLDSSNPSLSFDDLPPVEIAADERRTVTVEIDLDEQNATTVTARMMTPDGHVFGSSDEFIVRSSRVGIVLWATMGGAALFVVFALVRRFGKRRKAGTPSPAGELDD